MDSKNSTPAAGVKRAAAAARHPTVLQVLPALGAGGGVERGTVEIAQAIVEAGGRSLVASSGGPLAHEFKRASPVRTPGYNQFREVAETVGEDTWELFTAIQNLNPYAAEMRAELLGHLSRLQERLQQESGDDTQAPAAGPTAGDDLGTSSSG